MLSGQVRRRLSPQAASWGLRPVGDQNDGPLSGWLAARRLKKALPSSQRRRQTAQSRRPVEDSPPRPSERQPPGDRLPPPDFRFTPQTEPAPDNLPTAADEPPEARQTADKKAEEAPAGHGDERTEAAFSLVNRGDQASEQASGEAEPEVAPPADEEEPSAEQEEPSAEPGEPLADQPPATADQAARYATPAPDPAAPAVPPAEPAVPEDRCAAAVPQPEEPA